MRSLPSASANSRGGRDLTAAEERDLYALVIQAWELRDSGYLRDAVAAIEEWRARLPLTRYERLRRRSIAHRALPPFPGELEWTERVLAATEAVAAA